jgi:hypothetical protein
MTEQNNNPREITASADGIDLKKLADKVYALMMKDLRLERKRGSRIVTRRVG